MKKIQTGIWLDFREAFIITLAADGEPVVQHIVSDVDHHEVKGGSRSKTPWGPQYSPADRNTLERDKHSEHAYFRDILEHIGPTIDEIVIFGPAEAKTGLKKEIEQIKHYHPKLMGVFTAAHHISRHDMITLVRDFYNDPEAFSDKKGQEA